MIKDIIKNKNYEIKIDVNYIYIINYLKINDISFNNINVSLNSKKININGEKLIITKLDENEMLIKGVFKVIDFIDE